MPVNQKRTRALQACLFEQPTEMLFQQKSTPSRSTKNGILLPPVTVFPFDQNTSR